MRRMSERVLGTTRRNRAPGRVVRIRLDERRCGYGRQLLGSNVEFYDQRGVLGGVVDLPVLVTARRLFTVCVMDSAFRRTSGWELLEVVPLTADEQAVVYRRFRRDPADRSLTICRSDPAAGTYGEQPATVAEVAGLEAAALWSPSHVAERLRDHFDGRPNARVESLRPAPVV
jgi:hypothetical protein